MHMGEADSIISEETVKSIEHSENNQESQENEESHLEESSLESKCE